jgi:hypothetical protein
MKLIVRTILQSIFVSLILISFGRFVFSGDFEGYSGVFGTVGISVCGDGIVEGVEECEPSVAITNNCKDFGFDKGDLTCDPSCSFNKVSCEYNPPGPILPPFPDIFEEESEENIPPRILLPFFLTIYDIDSNGKISEGEYCDGLTYWLKKWRIRILNSQPEGDITRIAGAKDTCDLNFDKNCDLLDFSIFLHNK